MAEPTPSPSPHGAAIFADRPADPRRVLTLPWKRTIEMCWNNMRNRAGRFVLVFVSIAVVVAFLTNALAYQDVVGQMMQRDDTKTRAVLERAGVFAADPAALQKQEDQRTWLMILSVMMCIVGITNTMLMSVNERVREIGTFKCLGALDRFIVRVFMIESIFIGLVGSALGALVGFVLTLLQLGFTLEWRVLPYGGMAGTLVTLGPLAIAIGTVLTIIAAIYPTLHAARLKPVDAMRSEI